MKIFLPIILIIVSCSVEKKLTNEEKVKQHYDSLANELFLRPQIDLKATSNIDSFKIDFFTKEDFELIIDLRKSCQAISDSIGMRFKTKNYNIKDFGELEIEKQVIEYDTLLFPLIAAYSKRRNHKTFDSLRHRIGISPATIINFHDKVENYFRIINQDNPYTGDKRYLIITYYVSELTEVPYPKTLFRLFVNERNEVVDFGKHEDYDKEVDFEEGEVNEATTANNGNPTDQTTKTERLLTL